MEQLKDEMKDSESHLYRIRHSLAHVMAQVILEMRPGSRLGFGPPIDDGFYYDFILSSPITDEDFPEIEKRMRKFIGQDHKFERDDLPKPDALKRIDDMGEPYKREYAEELFAQKNIEKLSFYRTGPFLDMCEGPHVKSTREIPPDCFKIRRLAGAYWRGNSKNRMMTRIYAWAFENKLKLETHVKAYLLGLERDHKKLGQELEIFVIDDLVGKGLPLWLPNGTVIRDELEKYMREIEFKAGYKRVATPHLAKSELYYKTGHLPYYKESMYPLMEVRESSEDGKSEVKETYCLKPMNCPHHHLIFAARPRSYRELPVRLAEYGQVYRFEDSGALSGLLRVRGMCMNDAHIYCTEDQIKSEFLNVMNMHKEVYQTLSLNDYYMRLSTWDPQDPKGKEKFVDNPSAWKFSEDKVREAMVESGLKFVEGKGEAAFYGPKVDFQFRSVTGREETASTNQLDFAVPARLNMSFIGPDNKPHVPYVIHRAPLGTHERFVAFLIEHFGGAFPTWLAPVQVRMIPVSLNFMDYVQKLNEELRGLFVRSEIDESNETLNKKIRLSATQKIPNTLVIGEREVQNEQVTLKRYGIQEQKTMTFLEFKTWILDQIQNRKLSR